MKRALEEKKLAREEARNAERLAMHIFHEKTSLVEVFSKVCCQRLVYFCSSSAFLVCVK
jgi:kinetochore protein Nuf2